MTQVNNSKNSNEKQEKLITNKITTKDLHVSKPIDWLESRFHFAFANWWNGTRPYGNLYVMNDDLVTPSSKYKKSGFTFHPHRHMEIYSYIIEGYLSHQDSECQKEIESLGRGALQYMSAGSGVYHQEMNYNTSLTCRFIQTWIRVDNELYHDEEVRYGAVKSKRKERLNQLNHVISPVKPDKGPKEKRDAVKLADTPIKFRNDVNIYVCELESGKSVTFPLNSNRQLYLINIEGECNIELDNGNKISLNTREAFSVKNKTNIKFTGTGNEKVENYINNTDLFTRGLEDKNEFQSEYQKYPSSHFMLIEMRKS